MIKVKDISTLRMILGLTQKELGDKLSITQAQVGNWERGVHKPTNKIIKAITKLAKKNGIDFRYENKIYEIKI